MTNTTRPRTAPCPGQAPAPPPAPAGAPRAGVPRAAARAGPSAPAAALSTAPAGFSTAPQAAVPRVAAAHRLRPALWRASSADPRRDRGRGPRRGPAVAEQRAADRRPGRRADRPGDILGLLAGYGVVVLVALMARLPPLERGIGASQLSRWHALGGRYVMLRHRRPRRADHLGLRGHLRTGERVLRRRPAC